MKSSSLRSLPLLVLVIGLAACSSGGGGGAASFTVGGTVSGLNGTVVLQNNGADDLTITADGTFTFTTKIASNSTYLVTVLTQPSGQTCTASNNTGTVGTANVTDVSVVCSVNTYSVGGTVSGLTGTVVLQNNSGDNLSVSANGGFTFGTAVADGAGYSVTVKTHPIGQTCTASNNTGTISGAAVTNVSVVCSTNSYTIGGTVTGLTGTLVIRNNGTDDLTLPASSTSFTFAAKVAHGAGYAVTVRIQPTGQACTVTNGSGTATGNVINVSITCSGAIFGPRFSAAPNWNDYVKASDTATACDGTETGSYAACIHGGESKALQVPGKTTCTNLTATDALGAFDWTCDGSTNPVLMVSTGLKTGKYLSDLIDFSATPAWKQNSATVYDGATTYLTTYSSVWWTNPIMEDNDGGNLDVAGTIYTISTSTALLDRFTIVSSKVALVTKPGVTITTPGLGGSGIYASSRNFLWIESTLDATNDYGIWLTPAKLSVLRNVTVANGANGGVILGTNSSFNKLVHINVTNNLFGVSLGPNAHGNSLSLITAVSNSVAGVTLGTSNNNILSGVTVSGGGKHGLSLSSASSNTLSDITTKNNVQDGINITSDSDNNTFSHIIATNNGQQGFYASYASSNKLAGIAASNNGSNGVFIGTYSDNNKLSDITTSNNAIHGVQISSFVKNNTLANIVATNNGQHGLFFYLGANNNRLSGITVSNNGLMGIVFQQCSGNTLAGITAVNNNQGVFLTEATTNLLTGIAAANQSSNGLYLAVSSDGNRISDITSANIASSGVLLDSSSNNSFGGLLKVGNNLSDCYVNAYNGSSTTATDPGLDDDNNPGDVETEQVHNGLCIQEGSSTFGTATIGISLASSFVGRIYTDNMNANDTGSAVTYPPDPDSFDWLKFDNAFRVWGKDGAFSTADSQGRWTSGSGAIWDWSVTSADTVVRNALSLPTGNDTTTHIWYTSVTPTTQADCTAEVPESVFNTNRCESTILKNAVEIQGDSIGNDNLLCESNEACLYTPNIGSYQGHGNLISAGAFTNGTITGVTLMKYETNGR